MKPLCIECPIKTSVCKTKCSTEFEQIEKISAAEELWTKANEAFEAMCKRQNIISEIEEEYEANSFSTSSGRWDIQ